MGHVNNATYLSYLEEARISYFYEILNIPQDSLDFNAVVAKIDIDYLNELHLSENVEVLTRAVKFGQKSLDVEHLVITKRNGEILVAAKALTKLVSYNYKEHKSVNTPEYVKKAITEFERNNNLV
jgi:acyl-CoA thioester hydrolase